MTMAAATPLTDTEYRILALYRFVPLISPRFLECRNDDEQQQQPPVVPPQPIERHPTLLALQSELATTLRKHNVKGTILIAPEGINGTICYPASVRPGSNENDADPVATFLKTHPLFGGPDLRTRLSVWKENDSEDENYQHDGQLPSPLKQQPQQAFQRLKIKIKAEIVTLGLGRTADEVVWETRTNSSSKNNNIDSSVSATVPDDNRTILLSSPSSSSTLNHNQLHHHQRYKYNHCLSNPLIVKGTYLTPDQWDNVAIRNPNILVIDTRNTYEIEIGTFESAIDPQTKNFSDLPEYLEKLADEYDWSSYYHDDENRSGRSSSDNDLHIAIPTNIPSTKSTSCSSSSSVTEAATTTAKTTTTKKKPPPEGIAMFCTGGIRCEKATAYAIQSNLFPKDLPIYHLEGGILAYLDHVAKRNEKGREAANGEKITKKMKEEEGIEADDNGNNHGDGASQSKKNCIDPRLSSSWSPSPSSMESTFHGECFVFDKRVAVTEGLLPSKQYISCHGCRGPMDYRLMLSSDIADDGSITEAEDSGLEATRYQALAAGIPDLPPLRYDAKTQRHYLPGLTCPRCHASTTRESLERFAERNRQVEICKREGRAHFQDQGGV